jgi:hypothetical protein
MALQSADRVRGRRAEFGEPRSYAGYEVRDPLGNLIGIAEEVLADMGDEPRYVKVSTGLLGLKTALIPVQLVAVDTRRRMLLLR